MPDIYTVLLPVLIIGFILYRRISRSIGFQPYKKRRLIFRMCLFGLIGVMVLLASLAHPFSLLLDAAGVIAGLVLAKLAIDHTKFEERTGGLFFRTHIWIESIVLFLFLSRIVTRLVMIYTIEKSSQSPEQLQSQFSSPLTAGVFFLLVTFYLIYYGNVLRKGTRMRQKAA
ncbi:DUF1453 family protein [Metabacillus sp. GX 13764]|uniref:CcdC protein domain-containing protein n=1 Tax=Metabacillus kandeliae TaxID=2900151 RepID=UPI001E4614FA|nr:CcdC protein domain-containing protein [Metabacillus kandeliae]MCD7033998.1 DUF1453 family protein [Metabacillus kandeliae]